MNPLILSYGALALSILFEVTGTSFLQQSQQFSRPLPALGAVVSYILTFYFLSWALKQLPVGIVYAIWGGVGIVLISLIGLVAFKQRLDAAAILGIGLILAGVVIVNMFSKSATH
jgi:small multidrug resistance pump